MLVFFFFQAEDGIRDKLVTGVQTCALPISPRVSENNTGVSIHGGRGDDGKVNYDGMNTNNFYGNGGGQMRSWGFNTVAVQEIVVDTGGNTAETETGGANINMVPREGGNRFSLHSPLAYTNSDLASG